MAKADLPERRFEFVVEWAAWLDAHHLDSLGLWLQFAKKGSQFRTMTYAQALEVALCHGWIDGQKKAANADYWLQKFCPRAQRSLWSKINREKALELIANGKMKPAGLAAVESAKQNGRWEAAYDSPSKALVPEDFQEALDLSPKAKAFFETLDKANRYAVLWRIQTVKMAKTRTRKIAEMVSMLEREQRIH